MVAAQVGGLPELVLHGETGYLHSVNDLEGMAQGGLQILRDGKEKEFGAAARRRAVSCYSAERIVPLYERFYEEVINRTTALGVPSDSSGFA